MNIQKASKIVYQSQDEIRYHVPSDKTKPGGYHKVRFTRIGDRDCGCVGHGWLEKKGVDIFKDCRHKKMNTIYRAPENIVPKGRLIGAYQKLKLETLRPTSHAWADIHCQFPEHYNPIQLYCKSCPIYPEVCNIHKIRIPGKRNTLPLIWRFQTAIFNSQRKEAMRLLRKILKAVEKSKTA